MSALLIGPVRRLSKHTTFFCQANTLLDNSGYPALQKRLPVVQRLFGAEVHGA
jgi:hypothetical protein